MYNDSSILNPETMILEVPLNPREQELLTIQQNQYEKIYQKKISWVELLKQSFFFTTNQDMIKLAILNSYKQDEQVTTHEIANHDHNGHNTKKATNQLLNNKNLPDDPIHTKRKKRKVPLKTKNLNQTSLGGF